MQLTHNNTLMMLFLNNNNPLLLVFSASTVMALHQLPFHSALINWLASSTLAIYSTFPCDGQTLSWLWSYGSCMCSLYTYRQGKRSIVYSN